ncbi:MAG: aminoglycoside phosphotransferase family protein [Streptosporangiaceae bacterium]
MARCDRPWCPGPAPRPTPRKGADDAGYENTVTAGDADTLVKQHQRPARFRSEAQALRLLASTRLAPQLCAVCEPHRTLRMTRLEGRSLAAPLVEGYDSEHLAAAVGAHLRLLHRVTAPGFGPLHASTACSWPCFLRRHLTTRLASLPLTSGDLDRLWAFLGPHLGTLHIEGPRLLHHDLKPANILFGANGVIGFCDFEQARGGDPLSDLGKLWWRTFAATRSSAWRAFLTAYGSPEGDQYDRVRFYLVVHCIGALAYWHDYGRSRYLNHARSAAALLFANAGVGCSLRTQRRRIG